MFSNTDEQKTYIRENYAEVTDNRINDYHWDIDCQNCKVVRGFNVVKEDYAGTKGMGGWETDWNTPIVVYFRCPVCHMYKMWLIFKIWGEGDDEKQHYYRVTSIPGEGLEDIDELPENPPALRTAYRQAIRAMDANAHMASAAMFRRALQIITRDILGVSPGNLAQELKDVVGLEYNGMKITKNFTEVGYIIKEAGNQGAHPDQDPDLLDFTQQDAEDLQKIFMELVSELFVVPEAMKKAKDNFLKRRKISP